MVGKGIAAAFLRELIGPVVSLVSFMAPAS